MPEDTQDVASVSTDAGAAQAGDSSTPTGASVAPAQGASSADVDSQPSDQLSQAPPKPIDPLANVPSVEELTAMKARGVDLATGLLELRQAHEPLSAQHKELTTKYQVFEPYADKFQSPEEVQKVVELADSLSGYAPDPRDPNGALVPNVAPFVERITADDPERADRIASALVWGETKHPVTGQPIRRAELVLQVMAQDPGLRAHALKTLGGVEPSQVPAPTYAPTQEELDKIDDPLKPTIEGKALQALYARLPYEKRDELKLASPEYIKSELRTIQANESTAELNRQLLAEKEQFRESQERELEQGAVAAGDQYVEAGFRESLTNFANHLNETYKPTDNPVINRREAAQVALTVVSLSHPDTRWAGEQMLKEMGVDIKDLEPLNKAREAYAKSGRELGYLSHKKMRTNGDPARDQKALIGQAKALATKIIAGRDEYFKMRAASHNNELDQAATARPVIGGSPQTTQTPSGNRYLDQGKRTEAEIWG